MAKASPIRYRTTNWSDYNAALRKRGSLSVWFDPDMVWHAAKSGKRGRPEIFSDGAIQTCSRLKAAAERRLGLRLDDTQKATAALPLTSPVTAVAGYAGSGKTTVLSVIFDVLRAAELTPHPMELAGRAARRMEEAVKLKARTIAGVLHSPTVNVTSSDGQTNGEVVRGAFIIDAHDREIITWRAVMNAGISGSDIRDMMPEAIEARFDSYRASHPIDMLSDNGSP